jgi:hypothetical protein
MIRRGVWWVGGAVAAGLVVVFFVRSPWTFRLRPSAAIQLKPPAPLAAPSASAAVDDKAAAAADDAKVHTFRIPGGDAPALSCDAARAIVTQARTQLGYAPDPVDARAFADAAADWLDPFGLWSVAPDAPVAVAFDRNARDLVIDLEGRRRNCDAATTLGATMVPWVAELRAIFDDSSGPSASSQDATAAASASAFEGATVTRPARELAAELGRRVGVVARDLGAAGKPYVDAARSRFFPDLDAAGWQRVVLAAAVRAYVPSIDPHGAWAPLDEESSVYEVDLEAHPPSRLWDKAERTAIGLKIESGAMAPLADGDVVLSLDGVIAAGLSYEQAEQLGFAASEARPPATAVVIRPGEKLPITTSLGAGTGDSKAASAAADDDDLPVERIAYGDGDTVLVAIHDVRDDLGDELTRALLRERERDGRPIAGVVLDVRGNGGGSTDGAIDALGLFIPGASLFPMRRRDGSSRRPGRRRHRERRRDDRGRPRLVPARPRGGHDHVRQRLRTGVPRRRRAGRRRPAHDAAVRAPRRHARAACRAHADHPLPVRRHRPSRPRSGLAPCAAHLAWPRRAGSRGARPRRGRLVDLGLAHPRRQRRTLQGPRRLPRTAFARDEREHGAEGAHEVALIPRAGPPLTTRA